MVFEMTPDDKVRELLMEIKSFCDNFMSDMDGILEDLGKNEELDKKNDEKRNKIFKFLKSARTELHMGKTEEAEKCLEAMHQILSDQEQLDHQDNKYRDDAKIKLAKIRQRTHEKSEEIRKLILQIKEIFPPNKRF